MKLPSLFTCWWLCQRHRKTNVNDGASSTQDSHRELLRLDEPEDDDPGEIDVDIGTTTTPRKHKPKPSDANRSTTLVELHRKDGSGLGLVVSGGSDKDDRPHVSYLKPGGIAHRSDALQVGDYILAVNGIRTMMLHHDQVINVLKNAGDKVVLEIEYELPEAPSSLSTVASKRIEIILEKDGESLGFTLRGGATQETAKLRPLTITHIRPGSAADREGRLKTGDRVLAINGVCVTDASLAEATTLLRHARGPVSLLIEYDVSIMEAVENAYGPLLVEIDKTPGVNLGICLTTATVRGRNAIIIDRIRPASLADRCGALHVGDEILAIDDTSLEHMTLSEAQALLKVTNKEQIRLEILPASHNTKTKAVIEAQPSDAWSLSEIDSLDTLDALEFNSKHDPFSHLHHHHHHHHLLERDLAYHSHIYSTPADVRSGYLRGLPNGGSTMRRDRNRSSSGDEPASMSSTSTMPGAIAYVTGQHVCHTEMIEVALNADSRGFGLSIQENPFSIAEPPIIGAIEPRGPAEKCAVLQEGDRILAINGQYLENRTLEEAIEMLEDSGRQVSLSIEFDVADSVVPSSGVFTVKLAPRAGGLGFMLKSHKNRRPGEGLIISHVKQGSVSHRTGTIQAGDRLLAVGSLRLNRCTVEEAMEALQHAGEIVRLRIQREDKVNEDGEAYRMVRYTVELEKEGGPLGITISGTDELYDPIVISALTEGGLAEKTGALHIGDRILAIDGKSLYGCPLAEAIELLQKAKDVVTLKIARSSDKKRKKSDASSSDRGSSDAGEDEGEYLCGGSQEFGGSGGCGSRNDGTPILSVDSALESWDSCGLDANTMPVVPGKPPLPPKSRGGNRGSPNGKSYDYTRNYLSLDGSPYSRGDPLPPLDDESPELTPTGSLDQDIWSRNLDNLDMLSTSDLGPGSDTGSQFSLDQDLPPPAIPLDVVSLTRDGEPEGATAAPISAITDHVRLHVDEDEEMEDEDFPPPPLDMDDDDISDQFSLSTKMTAEMHLREVEEQLQKIFTPTPVELHRVILFKIHASDDFGFSLSDGVYEKGIYISAIRPGSPAERSEILKAFDRILQVNHIPVKDMECSDVLPLIATSGRQLELVCSRNPLADDRNIRAQSESETDDVWRQRPEHRSCPGFQLKTL